MKPLDDAFFHRDCLEVAPALVGKLLVRQLPDGSLRRVRITETEAYRVRRIVPVMRPRDAQSGQSFCMERVVSFIFTCATACTG